MIIVIIVLVIVIILWILVCRSQKSDYITKSNSSESNEPVEEKKYSDEFEDAFPWIVDATEIEKKVTHEYDQVKRFSKLSKEAKEIYILNKKELENIRFSRKRTSNEGQLSRRMREFKDMAYNIYKENKDKNFKDKLLFYIDSKGAKDSEIYSRAEISRQVFNNIINVKGYLPKKTTVFRLILALELNIEQANELLELSRHSFSKYEYEDVYVKLAIENEFYDVKKIYKEIESMQNELSNGN